MSSWEAAGATRSTVSESALPGIVSGSPSASRDLGKVLRRKRPHVEARAAAADLDVALRLAQLDLDLVVGERADEVREQPAGKQDRAGALDGRGELGADADLPIGRAQATESSEAVTRIPDNAWVAALVDTARETVESLEESSSRSVVSFKDKLLYRVDLGPVETGRGVAIPRHDGACGLWTGLWGSIDSYSGVGRQPARARRDCGSSRAGC